MVHWLCMNAQPSYFDQKLPFDARSGLNVCAFISQQKFAEITYCNLRMLPFLHL